MVTTSLPAGALVALATPVTADGEPDGPALERLLQRVISAGVAGISPCGSTGEGARLSTEQRLSITARVLEQAAGLPVIPGVPVASLHEAHRELARVGALGASAALVAPPSYFPSTERETENLYVRLADESPVPLVLYNIPAFTKTPLTPALVGRLAEHRNIVGIKDSSRDLEYLQAVIAAVRSDPTGTFRVYTGTDTMMVASVLAGADGTIAASANLVPRLGLRLLDLIHTDLPAAIELQQHLAAIVAACRKGSPPAGWKAALSLAGICNSALVPPAIGLDDEQIEQMWQDLHAAGVFGAELEEAR